MRIQTLFGAALLTAAVSSAAMFAPAQPAGACSLVDPCWEMQGEVALGQPSFEPIDVTEDALPPEWLDSTAVLHFNGTGRATDIELETTTFQF